MSCDVVTDLAVVVLDGVSKVYDRGGRGARWRDALPIAPGRMRRGHAALDDVSLRVEPGEALGIIGPNGAGKSTVLKLVAGVTRPTSGILRVEGTIGSMIELGVGFHPDLTGRENARTALVLHGASPSSALDALDEIEEFAGLGDAIGEPLKHYSMGMRARLAFAVATHFPADVLVVDEVLAVGDRDFQLRCLARIHDRLASGAALLFVSHEMTVVGHVCTRVVHLREGRVVDDGPAATVVERYLTQSPSRFRPADDPPIRIVRAEVSREIAPLTGFELEVELDVSRPVADPAIGVEISLPTVAPDLVSAACVRRVPAISSPGRYRLAGLGSPLAWENARMRVSTTAIAGMEVADVAHGDCRLLGNREGGRPWVAVEPEWTIEPADRAATTGEVARVQVEDAVVTVAGLTKRFVSAGGRVPVRAALPGALGRGAVSGVVALDGVDLQIGRGEAVGIIGPNGAGKSTLLRVLAGIVRADEGSVVVDGRVAPMLDLGAGLHGELTGRENLWTSAQLLGMTRPEFDDAMPTIMEFAGFESELDTAVKFYSSGMKARLGFAVALALPAEVLLIDELLAVGDEEFRRLALDAVAARVRAGGTVLFVSHELALVEQVCDRVVRLDRGRVVEDGPASEVIDRYGGSSWAGGVHDAVTGTRLLPLTVTQRHVPVGGRLEVTGEIVVDTPSPSARLELAYRAIPPDRSQALSPKDRENMSMLVETLEPAGGSLAEPGTYAYRLVIDRNEFEGAFDLVLALVDSHHGTILAETWQQVTVGAERPQGFPGPVLDVEWRIVDGPAGSNEVAP
jgi:ABC-type polysaccharide/polyol phosphate transport system ATPase subunit